MKHARGIAKGKEEFVMTNFKRISVGIILSMLLVLSVGGTVLAAQTTTSFVYEGKTVKCVLNVDWDNGIINKGYAKTYVSGGSGNFPLGAYCNAYKNGNLVDGRSITAYDSAQTETVTCIADEYRSVHNIQNSNRVPLKSTKLSLTE